MPDRGVWDMRGKQFHSGVEVHLWTIVVFATVRQCPEDKLRYNILVYNYNDIHYY